MSLFFRSPGRRNPSLPVALAATLGTAGVLSASMAGIAKAQSEVPASDVMIVLDASGSMWGQVEGEPKIGIVRNSLGGLLNTLEENKAKVGLITYGHRRKGDCSDIEMMSEPALGNSDNIEGIVKGINPKGKTPLGAAVRMAAETLKFTENKATVLLLSDGIETCGVDPCALGQELESLGIDFTTHVIGFDLEDDDAEELVCLAESTGGRYLSADNASELGEALRDAGTVATETSIRSPETLEAIRIRAVLDDTGEPAGRVVWTVKDAKGERIIETPLSDISMTTFSDEGFEPGEYSLKGRDGDFEGEMALLLPLTENAELRLVRIVPETQLSVIGPVSAFSPFSVQWSGTGGKDDAVGVVRRGTDASGENLLANAMLNSDGTASLTAPDEGQYDLVYIYDSYGLKRIDERIPLSVGPVSFSLEPVGDIWAGEAFLVSWTGPGGSADKIAIGPRTSGSSDYNSIDDVTDGNPLRLRAPSEPGEYELRYYGRNYTLLYTQPVTVE